MSRTIQLWSTGKLLKVRPKQPQSLGSFRQDVMHKLASRLDYGQQSKKSLGRNHNP